MIKVNALATTITLDHALNGSNNAGEHTFLSSYTLTGGVSLNEDSCILGDRGVSLNGAGGALCDWGGLIDWRGALCLPRRCVLTSDRNSLQGHRMTATSRSRRALARRALVRREMRRIPFP